MPAAAPPSPPAARPRRGRALSAALLLLIILGAALLRLWNLDRIPPGLNHDEGVNALDVERIIAGWRPVFLPDNNGREALFMYLQAAVGVALGVTPFALRLTAALCGTATVAATFGLARQWYGPRLGFLASGLLAVAFWHVVLSRVGLRAILAPLCYVLVMWAVGTALLRPRLWRFALAGALLGLAQYTYISARLLPPILLLPLAAFLWLARRRGQSVSRQLAGLGLLAIAALLTVLPEALYFWHHPDSLIGRTDQVLVFNSHPAIIGLPITFQESVRRTLGMFWVQGDANWLHNIAGLPVLDPLLTVVFVCGLVVLLVSLGRGPRPLPRRMTVVEGRLGTSAAVDLGPALWLGTWVAALLAGSSVTQESPNYLRLTAMMPAVAIICAVGATWLSSLAFQAARRRGWRVWSALPTVLLAALVLGEGTRTAFLYFGNWAHQGAVYTAFDTDIRDAASASRHFDTVPIAATTVQLDASAPFLYFRPESAAARWLREYTTVLLLPPVGQPGLWIYSHVQRVPPLPAYFPAAQPVAEGDAHPGHPGFFVYQLDAAALSAFRAGFTTLPRPMPFGDRLQLVATRLETPGPIQPGSQVVALLRWRVLQADAVNFGFSLRLTDEHGLTWAQSDQQGMERNGWRVGDELVSRHALTIPEDTPPLTLSLEAGAGLLDPLQQPAAVLQTLGTLAEVGTVSVLPGAPGNVAPPTDARVVAPGLYLTDARLGSTTARPGDLLPVTVRWLRTAPLPPLTATVELLDANGKVVATTGGAADYGALPLALLASGRVVADPRQVLLPATVPAGPLAVVLVAGKEGGPAVGRLTLGTVTVQDRAHSFSAPPAKHLLSADFNGQLALLGYDLAPPSLQPGGHLSVTLHWRALRTPDLDYTVFVHVLDLQGHLVAQDDSQPVRNTVPTRGWLPGEVVVDEHTIALPPDLAPGEYHLEVGWYDARSGGRLPLASPASGDHLVLPEGLDAR